MRAVEIDQVRVPRLVIQIYEQRRVTGHGHHIGIAFQADHKRRLTNGTPQVALTAILIDRVFTHEHLGTVAIGVVVEVRMTNEPVRGTIVMVVHHIGRAIAVIVPTVGDQCHVRILRLDRPVE